MPIYLKKKLYLCISKKKANHNKDYSVVKTSRVAYPCRSFFMKYCKITKKNGIFASFSKQYQ